MHPILNKIRQLKPSTYEFRNTTSKEEHDGFIAQDVMKLFPGLVTHNINKDRNLDVYAMNYDGFGVLAIKAIQELMQLIDELEKIRAGEESTIEDLGDRAAKLETVIGAIKKIETMPM